MTGSAWEGWFTDPFGPHESRWLPEGKPTNPVRDGDVESYDEPPDETFTKVPERIADPGDGRDLHRVEDPWGPTTESPILGAPRVFDEERPSSDHTIQGGSGI